MASVGDRPQRSEAAEVEPAAVEATAVTAAVVAAAVTTVGSAVAAPVTATVVAATEVADALEHEQPNPRDPSSHDIALVPGTLLARIAGAETMRVNSAHHQAVATPGKFAVVNASAPDGVIEGIEDPRYAFCLGVQWHPEFLIDPADAKIFQAFIDASGG